MCADRNGPRRLATRPSRSWRSGYFARPSSSGYTEEYRDEHRRAATAIRNDRGARTETVEKPNRRSCRRCHRTWGFPRILMILNTTQFLARRSSTDLARRSPAQLDVGLAMIASGGGLEFCCYSERSAVAGCRRLAAQAGTVATRLAARTVPAAVAIRGRAGTTGPASTPI
jgi:hypothetical protein